MCLEIRLTQRQAARPESYLPRALWGSQWESDWG